MGSIISSLSFSISNRNNLAPESLLTVTVYSYLKFTLWRSRPRHHLLSLPQELKDEIWKLAFAPDHEPADKVDLFQAIPPTKDLLLVSRAVYNETRQLYREAYRAYWSTTQFILHQTVERRIPLRNGGPAGTTITIQHLESLKRDDIRHIRKMTIWVHDVFQGVVSWHLLANGGLWVRIVREPPAVVRTPPVFIQYWFLHRRAPDENEDRDSVQPLVIIFRDLSIGGRGYYDDLPEEFAIPLIDQLALPLGLGKQSRIWRRAKCVRAP